MNISQFGAKEKKTRLGYKDKQKKDAFMQMQHVGEFLIRKKMCKEYQALRGKDCMNSALVL